MPRATTTTKAPALTQRSTAAVEQASAYLGLDDVKRLGAAISIAAAELLSNDFTLQERVRAVYADLAPTPKPVSGGKKVKAPEVELIPVKDMEGRTFDPLAPLDPYLLLELYGAHQLRLALQGYAPARLRDGVRLVQSKHKGTKPEGSSKQALIDYIALFLLPATWAGSN